MTTDTLIEVYLPLANKLASAFAFRQGLDRDSAIQEASMALQDWAPSLDTLPSEAFACKKITCWLQDWARHERRHQPVSLDEPTHDSEGNVCTRADLVRSSRPSPEDEVIAADLEDQVMSALELVPPDLRQALKLHFLADLGFARVGEQMGGISARSAKRLSDAGLQRLRRTI
jgi:RNA polymerase sigma factor (sigma-70 family)